MNSHFGLDQTPFQGPQEDGHYYNNAVFDSALTTLVDGIASDALVLLLTGEPGTGKTAVLRRFRAHLETSASVVSLPIKSLEWAEFLDALYAVAEPEGEAKSCADKTEALRSYLLEQRKTLRTVLLLDDAQHVDPEFVENLTALAASHATAGNLLHIVLAGTPALQARLKQAGVYKDHDPTMVCSSLKALPPQEVRRFIQHELEACGHHGEAVFSPDALDTIAFHSLGLPRRIQIICSAAMRVAYEKDMPQVHAEIVEGLVGRLERHETSSAVASATLGHLRQSLQKLGSVLRMGLVSASEWVKRHREEVGATLADDGYLLPASERPHAPPRHNRRLKTQMGLAIGIGCLAMVIWVMALVIRGPKPVPSEIFTGVTEQGGGPAPYSRPAVADGGDTEASADTAQTQEPPIDQIASLQAQYAELKSLLEQAVLSQQDTQQKYQRLVDDYSVLAARTDRLGKQLVADDAPIQLAGVKSVNEKAPPPPERPALKTQRSAPELKSVELAATEDADTKANQPQDPGPGEPQSEKPDLSRASRPAASGVVMTAPIEIAESSASVEGTLTLAPRYTSPLAEQPIPFPVAERSTQRAETAVGTGRVDETMVLTGTLPGRDGVGAVIPIAGPKTDFPSGFTGETVRLASVASETEIGLFALDTAPPTPVESRPVSEAPARRPASDAQTEPRSSGEVPLEDDNATPQGVEKELAAAAAVETPPAKRTQTPTEKPLPTSQASNKITTNPSNEAPRPSASLDADLARAVESQRDATVAELLARGARPDARTSTGDTVLMSAAAHGNPQIVAALLTNGAPPDQRNAFAETALMKASWHGHNTIVASLLDGGAGLEALNADGWSALFYAAINGHVETVRALLLRGARVNVQSRDGRSALAAAVWNSHAEVAETLLASGADANQKDVDGWTPLMAAAWNGDTLIMQALIENGADHSQQSNSGQTALLVAKTQGHIGAVQLLKEP